MKKTFMKQARFIMISDRCYKNIEKLGSTLFKFLYLELWKKWKIVK